MQKLVSATHHIFWESLSRRVGGRSHFQDGALMCLQVGAEVPLAGAEVGNPCLIHSMWLGFFQ